MTAPEKTEAILFIEKLLRVGGWYLSAIELDDDVYGEDLFEEAKRIVDKIDKEEP